MMPVRPAADRGYAMAALLVALSVMSIMASAAFPVWRTWVQRERETELVFRGEQYVQAIELFSRRTGGFPTSLDSLRTGRYIRKLYKDPITNEDFQPVYLGQLPPGALTAPGQPGRGQPTGQQGRGQQGLGQQATPAARGGQRGAGGPGFTQQPGTAAAGPIIGVSSKSTAESIRQYNGRGRYNEWLFVSTAATRQAGAPAGVQAPGRGAPGTAAPGGGFRGGRRGIPPGGPGFPGQPPGRRGRL